MSLKKNKKKERHKCSLNKKKTKCFRGCPFSCLTSRRSLPFTTCAIKNYFSRLRGLVLGQVDFHNLVHGGELNYAEQQTPFPDATFTTNKANSRAIPMVASQH